MLLGRVSCIPCIGAQRVSTQTSRVSGVLEPIPDRCNPHLNDCHRRDAGATAPLALVFTPLLDINSLSKQRKTDRQQCAALTASYELLLRRIGLE